MAPRLDAVLPLTAGDAPRARVLVRSLEAFFEPLRTCHVVVPDAQVETLRGHLPAARYELVPETALVPELRRHQALGRLKARLRIGCPANGWHVQQLVKLAAAELVATDVYLTLDADVICVRPTGHADLVDSGGRALAQITPPHHPEWNDAAERILGLPRSGRQHGVTPALLSRAGVRALQEHLAERGGGSWRRYLLRSLPWTEYSLYGTFLEGTGLWDRYHVDGGAEALYGNCVWMHGQWPEWDPAASFETGRFPFSVIQSATRIPPAEVWERVAPYLGAEAGEARRARAPAGEAAGS